jgi:hypothetical protein
MRNRAISIFKSIIPGAFVYLVFVKRPLTIKAESLRGFLMGDSVSGLSVEDSILLIVAFSCAIYLGYQFLFWLTAGFIRRELAILDDARLELQKKSDNHPKANKLALRELEQLVMIRQKELVYSLINRKCRVMIVDKNLAELLQPLNIGQRITVLFAALTNAKKFVNFVSCLKEYLTIQAYNKVFRPAVFMRVVKTKQHERKRQTKRPPKFG